MSENSPCLSCGACCANFRVSFFWGECQSAGGCVPDHLVEQVGPHHVAMLGTTAKPVRCVGLQGEVGGPTRCSLYEQRSSTCREFTASWEDGQVNPHCDAARAAHGLAPLLRSEQPQPNREEPYREPYREPYLEPYLEPYREPDCLA